jgi:hypothetical protein
MKGLFNQGSQRNREEESRIYRTLMSHSTMQKLTVLDKASRPHVMSTTDSPEYYLALEALASRLQSSLVEASLFQLNSLSAFLEEVKQISKSHVIFRTNGTVWTYLMEIFEYFIERTCTVNNQTRERKVSFTLNSMQKKGSKATSSNGRGSGNSGEMSMLFGATTDASEESVVVDKTRRAMQVSILKIIHGISLLCKTRKRSHIESITLLATIYRKQGKNRDFIAQNLEWMVILRVILELFENEEYEGRNANGDRWDGLFTHLWSISAVEYYTNNVMGTQHSVEDMSGYAPFEIERLMEVPNHVVIASMIKEDAVEVVRKDIYHALKETWSIISPDSQHNFKSIMARKDTFENEVERDLDDEDVEQFGNKILLRYLGQFIV